MAATKSAKSPTPNNDTPKVREGAIAKMKVDELRHKLRGHGVKGTADLKKPELVKQLIKAEAAATKKSTPTKKSTATKKSTPAKKSTAVKKSTAAKSAPAKKAAGAKASAAAKKTTATKTSVATKKSAPTVSDSPLTDLKVDQLRRKLRGHGVKGTADLKKPELVKQLTKIEVTGAKKKAPRKKSA